MSKNEHSVPMKSTRGRTGTNVFDTMTDTWKKQVISQPTRYEHIVFRAAQTRAYIAEMRMMDATSPQLQRMGAILLLCSLIEGRITAMYEDRIAVNAGKTLPSGPAKGEEVTALNMTPEKSSKPGALKQKILLLHKHGDITDAMLAEYDEFRTYRNALIHDATHHGKLFNAQLVNALIDLYQDLVRVRRRVRSRVRKANVAN